MLRNLIVFTIGVIILSTLGGLVTASGGEAGALLFLSGPLLMTVILRTVGGDGWADSGLRVGRPHWYVFGLLIFPVVFALTLAAGSLTGSVALTVGIGAVLTAAALELTPRLVFAGFEELGWRGYLEPRLAALGVPDLRRHLLVGGIWALWHVPYILSFPGYTELALVVFAPLFVAGVLVMAVVYGQLRKASGSVWPVVIAHGVGNALAFPLVMSGFADFRQPALLATRPESLLFIVAWAVVAWTMLSRRRGEARD